MAPLDESPRGDAGTTQVRLPYFDSVEGMFELKSPDELTGNQAVDIVDFRIDNYGKLVPAEDTGTLTTLSSQTALDIYGYQRDDGSVNLIVPTTVGFQARIPEGSFVQLSGTAMSDLQWGDFFSFVGWGNYVITANPVVGMHKLNLTDYTYTEMSGVPVGPNHVTVFGNRVVVTRPVHLPGRIQWSVKNDSDDWTGLGSGYEDLLASGGTRHDSPWSVWPVDETRALVVRERSVWLMSLTGFSDAPFKFERLFDGIGTAAPRSIAAIPGGIMMMTYNNFVIVTPDGYEFVGSPIEHIFNPAMYSSVVPKALYTKAVYVRRWNEYWLGYQTISGTYMSWRYNLARKAWTRSTNSIPGAYVEWNSALATDDIAATFDSSSLELDVYGGAGYPRAAVYYPAGSSTIGVRYVMPHGSFTAPAVSSMIVTGNLPGADDPDATITVTRVSIFYEYRNSDSGGTFTIDYTSDQGVTWSTYSSFTISGNSVATTKTLTYTVNSTVFGKTLRFRFYCVSPQRFRLLKIVFDVLRGDRTETIST